MKLRISYPATGQNKLFEVIFLNYFNLMLDQLILFKLHIMY